VADLADSNSVFGVEARDLHFLLLVTLLGGSVEDAWIVGGYSENHCPDRILTVMPVELSGFMLPEEPEEGCCVGLLVQRINGRAHKSST
jgi:hypothetical protein